MIQLDEKTHFPLVYPIRKFCAKELIHECFAKLRSPSPLVDGYFQRSLGIDDRIEKLLRYLKPESDPRVLLGVMTPEKWISP